MTEIEDRLTHALTIQADAIRPDPEAAAGRLRAALRVRRRHTRAATAMAAAVVVAGVAVGLTVPSHTRNATVVPARPSTPYPTYHAGGKAIAGGQITSPAQGTLTFTFVPTSYALVLWTFCSSPHTLVSVAINGHLASFGGCGGGLGGVADAAASRVEWKTASAVVLGHPNTVTVTLVDGDTPTAKPLKMAGRPAGTVTSAIYQGIPVADYPLPAKPAHLPPLTANGGEPVVLDSRTVGADGTFALLLSAGGRLDVTAIGPGQIDLKVNGQHLQTSAFWTYGSQTVLIDLSAARLLGAGVTTSNGQQVTVTVTATRFTGPYWLVGSPAPARS